MNPRNRNKLGKHPDGTTYPLTEDMITRMVQRMLNQEKLEEVCLDIGRSGNFVREVVMAEGLVYAYEHQHARVMTWHYPTETTISREKMRELKLHPFATPTPITAVDTSPQPPLLTAIDDAQPTDQSVEFATTRLEEPIVPSEDDQIKAAANTMRDLFHLLQGVRNERDQARIELAEMQEQQTQQEAQPKQVSNVNGNGRYVYPAGALELPDLHVLLCHDEMPPDPDLARKWAYRLANVVALYRALWNGQVDERGNVKPNYKMMFDELEGIDGVDHKKASFEQHCRRVTWLRSMGRMLYTKLEQRVVQPVNQAEMVNVRVN